MQNKPLLYFSICCGFFLWTSCNNQKANRKVSPEQQATWNTFISVIQSNDKERFEKISTRTLSCLPCLDNSDEEREELQLLAAENKHAHLQWISQNKYVYTKAFLDQDFALLFTPKFLANLSKTSITFTTVNKNNFVVTVDPPPPSSTEKESLQYTFGFTKKEEGFKLTNINTLSTP
ncbi:hypothetical protein MWU59_05920 [Flavobacteriaceae bacterium F08102]|nr:hypothetical protein [Flavobacteriaceae bacterium F08102]